MKKGGKGEKGGKGGKGGKGEKGKKGGRVKGVMSRGRRGYVKGTEELTLYMSRGRRN